MSILLFLGLCLTMGAQAQYSFVVNGEITTDDCENCKVYLQRLDLDWVKAQIENPDAQPVNVDSAVVKDGKFVLRYAGKERGELLNVAMPEKNFACQAIGEEGTIRMEVRYFEKKVTFIQKFRIKGRRCAVKGFLEYAACNDMMCIPPATVEFSVKL